MSVAPLVDIRDLTVEYVTASGLLGQHHKQVRVLDSFNLQVHNGETLGIVGESGCGKTTLANSIARFIRPTSGQVLFEGQDILRMDQASMRRLRRGLQMVFQNPFNSLDPRMAVLSLVGEGLLTHTDLRGKSLQERVEGLLAEVGLPAEYVKRYPHELSGGQAQRVALARALALSPKLLLLDEPTSALDVSVQAQVINLLMKLQEDRNLTYLFISHNLSLIQHISDRIAVLYLGEIVELAPHDDIFQAPLHPYTRALFSATPTPDPDSGDKPIVLQGDVPSLNRRPTGCGFHTRCPYVMDRCRIERPVPRRVGENHQVSCHLV